MEIRIDGEPGLLSLKPDASVTKLLEQIENTLTASGRISTSYFYNGEKLTPSLLQASWDNQAPHGLLNIETTPLKSHLLDLLNQLSIGVSESNRQLEAISEGITLEDSSKAEAELSQWCNDLSSTCSNLAKMTNLLNISISSIDVDGEPFSELFSRITNHSKKMLSHIKNQEKVLCADLIECEIIPDNENVSRAIAKLSETVEKALP